MPFCALWNRYMFNNNGKQFSLNFHCVTFNKGNGQFAICNKLDLNGLFAEAGDTFLKKGKFIGIF